MQADAGFPYPPDDPERVRELVLRCRLLAARATHAARALQDDASRLTGSWQGPAASACQVELRHAASLTRRLAAPSHEASVALERFERELRRARAAIDRLRAGYQHELVRHRHETALVWTSDAVPPRLRPTVADELRWGHQHELGGYHRRYAAILEDLQAHARAVGRELGALAWSVLPAADGAHGSPADAEPLLVASLPWLAAQRRLVAGSTHAVPAAGTPGALVRRWWTLLTPDEQQRLVDTSPAAVGRLDGLPAHVRSSANERLLDALLAGLQGRAHLQPSERRALDNCLAVRRELDLGRRSRGPRTREAAVVQLLVFEPRAFSGEGRAAVAVGDVDTADHVAFLVPGLDANLRDSLAGVVGTAALLGREADRAGDGTTTSAVAWVGYDAPGFGKVAGDGAAEAGADLLAADLLAVQAARDVVPHLTVIGHSYGSTTTGTALRDHVTGVDEAVLVGSPGPNVEHVSALQVPAGHVFVGASSRDPVSYLDRFGLDPTHESFGAVRFRAEDVTRSSWRLDVSDHSKYFEPKTESLSNIVRIVVGRPGEVAVAAYREELLLLPDGINADPEADREPTVPAR